MSTGPSSPSLHLDPNDISKGSLNVGKGTLKFSPLLISALIEKPLKYFFKNVGGQYDLLWDEDEKKSQIDITSINNYNNPQRIENRPRIVVSRGGYGVRKTALSNNMAEAPGIKENLGKSDRTNIVFVEGQASILIEARNEGTCDLIADMVSHFFIWSHPFLTNELRFKEFGYPMSVSECTPSGPENTEKFTVTITLPWMMEDPWNANIDALRLKTFYTTLRPMDADQPITRIT